jgi:3',5'-cyclic AMP phosphodiesterase CpdA/tetratricopeptide (TPR) repeat protein
MSRAKIVFFSMPFGTKPVGDEHHDFDETWKKLLKAAVPDGWEDKRIDEVDAPGTIPEQFKEYLRSADVVVFDLTSANPNVLYELGIRDVFAPGRRVLVARVGTVSPFNIAAERVLYYAAELQVALAEGFPHRLREQILQVRGGATSPRRAAGHEARLIAQIDRATTRPALVSIWREWEQLEGISVDPLLRLARLFSEHRRLDLAIDVARRAYQEAPDEWEVARTLGWYLRRDGQSEEAVDLLRQAIALNPADLEALGMLGGLYKRYALDLRRAGDMAAAKGWFQQCQKMYSDASKVDPQDFYSLVNSGALSFIGGEPTEGYGRIVEVVGKDPSRLQTWDLLAFAEAELVVGDPKTALAAFASATQRRDFTHEMRESQCDQLGLLEEFGLAPSVAAEARSILRGEKERRARRIVVIHLSDVHFGKKPDSTEMHRFRQRSGLHDHRSLAAHVLDECKQELVDGAALFVVISGDIAYQAVNDEYGEATIFIRSLLEGLQLGLDRLVVVPGNHDVNWKLSGYQLSHRFDAYLSFLSTLYGTEQFKAIYPHVDWDFRIDSPRPPSHKILSFQEFRDLGIVFVGFNSCVLEDHELHFGAIGQEQIKLAEALLANVPASLVRVAVLHHHVLPLESRLSREGQGAEMDGTLVRDYSLVERALHALNFDLVLHGHKHEPGIRVSRLIPQGKKSLIVCGAGSVGVEKGELPPDWGNHFAIYRLPGAPRREGQGPPVEIEWRTLPVNDLNRRWDRQGPWLVES